MVLSAGKTGLGRAESSEGLIGLRRTFRTAGAKTVISSLWSVKDQATAELMRAFYGNLLKKGMPRHRALREAQLEMLKSNRIQNDNAGLPSIWGAFVLSGEWR
ncbi:MAG: CHAT domain-containing protein [Planctomycetota bacterium]